MDPCRNASPAARRITESATLAVDAKAKALKAAGRPVIGFGAGEPDFPTPDYIVDAAEAACSEPRYHRYTPAGGLPELRGRSRPRRTRLGPDVSAAQVLVTNGGKQAIYEAFASLLDPGDEVLVPAPYWTTYPEAIKLAGGVPVEVATDERSGYRATVEQLEAARTERTKVLLFVSPSNPTGAVYSPEGVAAIGRWAASTGLWVVTDEIYEHLVYGDAQFSSIPVGVPSLADRCVVVNGVAKTYAMTGWRVGWLIGPQDVVKAATNLQSHATSNVANVSQAAALAAVTDDLSAVEDMRVAFDRRRQTIVRMLNEVPGVDCPEPEGAFYVYPSVKGALGREIRGRRREPRRALRPRARGGRGRDGPGRGVRHAGLRPAVLRPRRRRPRRGHRPAPPAARRREPAPRSAGGRARPPAAQGAPAPALHRLDAARDLRELAAEHGVRLPTRSGGAAAGADRDRRARLVPVPAALRHRALGAADRGRRTPAAARGRRGRAADGSGWLEIQVDPRATRPRFGGITPSLELVLDAAREAEAHRRRLRRDRRGQPHPAPAGRPDAGPAGGALRRRGRRRVRPVQRRAPGRHRGVRAGVRIARRAGLASVPHGGELRRATCAPAWTCSADRLGHGVRAVEDPGCWTGLADARIRWRCARRPTSARGRRRTRGRPAATLLEAGVRSPSAPTTRCCSARGWPTSTRGARDHGLH